MHCRISPRIGQIATLTEERDTFTRLPWLPDEGHREGVQMLAAKSDRANIEGVRRAFFLRFNARKWLVDRGVWTPAEAANLLTGASPDDGFQLSFVHQGIIDFIRDCANSYPDIRDGAPPGVWLEWASKRSFSEWVSADLKGMARDVGIWSEATRAPAMAPTEPVAKPLQRQPFQEAEILRVLREMGHNPAAMPRNKPGMAGPKAEARKRLGFSKGVFDGAWERLRADDRIADA